jgi:hypothetical protein
MLCTNGRPVDIIVPITPMREIDDHVFGCVALPRLLDVSARN